MKKKKHDTNPDFKLQYMIFFNYSVTLFTRQAGLFRVADAVT